MFLIDKFFSHFGDVEKLSFPSLDINNENIDYEWVRYNPRKNIDRFGISITSLDGGMTGEPDLDSLREYNEIHNTEFKERDFNVFTDAANLGSIKETLSNFSLGRCHFIKLEAGGHFPWHRDGGLLKSQGSFRLLCPIVYDEDSFVWLQEDKQVKFNRGSWYVINTTKRHAVFSFATQIILVANILNTENNVKRLIQNLHTK